MAIIKISGIHCVDMGVGVLLNISVPNNYKKAVQTILDSFKDGNEYDIKPHKHKRSLNANAYCWVLADKIAQKIDRTKEFVYRDAVSHVGVFDEVKVSSEEAAKRFKQIWYSHGVGWLTKSIDKTTIQAYYGSSTYDTQQMARLIDYLVQEAKDMDIEPLTPEELARIKDEWGK